MPRVSVIMTLYNKGEYVGEAVRSILDGTYKDLELIVIDDASTDEGPAVVRSFEDPRVRLLPSERNQGRAASANLGYAAARGEYIAILDADDIARADRLEKQVEFMDSHLEIGVSGTAAQCFGLSKEMLHFPRTDEECRARLLFTDPVLYGSSIFRSTLFREQGIRGREDWTLPGEDYLLMLQVAKLTRFGNLAEPLLSYRIGQQNQRHGRDAIQDRGALCQEVFRHFGIPITSEELLPHLLYHQLFAAPITVAFARRFLVWQEELTRRVARVPEIPFSGFKAELHRRFRKVFFLIADRNLRTACYLFLVRHELRSWSSFRYLVKVTFDRWFNKAAR